MAPTVSRGQAAPIARPAVERTPVILERSTAAPDSDTATRQTVERMCGYIRDGAADVEVQRAARYAAEHFGMGLPSPAMKAWAVFWWVKHSIRFRQDEATMFRIGEHNQQDLLIAPAVLVRMRDPAEDCDGFTMLAAAMLTVLNVPVVIATVAADPSDRARWSHVFPCALLPGGQVLPVDASHGPAPGWMVPPEHIFRWQAWDLDGRPVEVRPLAYRGLHGYRRTSTPGMGDCDPLQFEVSGMCVPGGPSSTSSGNWTAFFQDMIRQGVALTGKVLTPPAYQQTVRDPVTGQLLSTTVRTATPSTALTAGAGSLTSVSPWLIGGAALLGLVVVAKLAKGNG